MESFERFVGSTSKVFDYIARFGVVAMMVLIVANVLLRVVWHSIVGTYDYVCIIGAVLVGLSLAYCGYKRGHIEIEILMDRLPARVQGVIGSVVNLVSVGFFSVVAWQLVLLGNEMAQTGESTMTLFLPFHSYIYVVAFCSVALILVILVHFLKNFRKALGK